MLLAEPVVTVETTTLIGIICAAIGAGAAIVRQQFLSGKMRKSSAACDEGAPPCKELVELRTAVETKVPEIDKSIEALGVRIDHGFDRVHDRLDKMKCAP